MTNPAANDGADTNQSSAPRQVLCIRGEISATEACSLHSHLVSDQHKAGGATSSAPDTSVSLLLLHGSWNLLCKGSDSALSSILYAACGSSPHDSIRSFPLSVASVRVDVDDASEDAAIDVLNAPPNLPALALVVGGDIGSGNSNSTGIIRYVDIDQTVLLSYLRSAAGDGEVVGRHHEYDRTLKNIADELHFAETMDTDEVGGEAGDISCDEPAVRIFIAGDRSQVGKSSVCLGLIGSLLKMGYPPSLLAYIKPATQCEATQLVAQYCDKVGVANRPIGPVVYYKGFTRAFLAGETEDTSQLLAEAGRSVDDIAQGRRVVIVDGVGYPAVGSICGTDNAAVAAACGRFVDGSKSSSSNTGSFGG